MKKVNSIINNYPAYCRIVVLFAVFNCNTAISQNYNLVPNYSFENYTSYSYYIDVYPPWKPATASTNTTYIAGVFNACNNGGSCCGVPSNIFGTGYQYARTGNGYASMFLLAPTNGSNCRNYAQVPLSDSLMGGHLYYVEFYANLVNRSAYACNNLGLYISKTAPTFNPGQIIAVNPQIINYGNKIISDTLNWIKVSGVYMAQGGEQYITIGNFKTDAQTDTLITHNPLSANCAQYNIDDVSVIPLDSFCLKADAGKDTTINLGDSVFIGSLTNGIDSIKWQVQGNTIDSTRPGFWVKPAQTTSYILQQVVNGCFSADTVKVIVGTVPLKFIKFEASPQPSPTGEGVRLDWVTANEVNVSHFYIQRSVDAVNFKIIGQMKAQDNTLNNYSFVDETPQEGMNYYRIVSVDKDGKTSFSEVRTINIEHRTSNIAIYPNPAKDVVNVIGSDIKEVKIINCLGQEISRQEPRNDAVIINIKGLNKGLYIVQVMTTKGEVKTEKLIVE